MKIVVHGAVPQFHAAPGETLQRCDPGQVVALLRRYGEVLFRGFGPDTDDVVEFTDQFGACTDVRAEGGHDCHPYTSDAAWMHCHRTRAESGRVIDGGRMLGEMSAAWGAFARKHSLRFDRVWGRDSCRRALGGYGRALVERVLDRLPRISYEFRPNGTLFTSYAMPLVVRTPGAGTAVSRSALRALLDPPSGGLCLADGHPVPDAFLDHVRDRAVAATRAVDWAYGDLAVLDNQRMLYHPCFASAGLRIRHSVNMLGSFPPPATAPLSAALKRLLQSEPGRLLTAVPA